MRNIREAVEAYVEDMERSGEALPGDARVLDAPAVSVTV
jgi:predicted RNase H-like HicB family nuclease